MGAASVGCSDCLLLIHDISIIIYYLTFAARLALVLVKFVPTPFLLTLLPRIIFIDFKLQRASVHGSKSNIRWITILFNIQS